MAPFAQIPLSSFSASPELARITTAFKDHFPTTLKAVLLFGSRARETHREESDYDILVIIEDLPAEPIARLIRERVGSEWFWHFPGIQKKPWELTCSGYREL